VDHTQANRRTVADSEGTNTVTSSLRFIQIETPRSDALCGKYCQESQG
jgi:hypothetical protein